MEEANHPANIATEEAGNHTLKIEHISIDSNTSMEFTEAVRESSIYLVDFSKIPANSNDAQSFFNKIKNLYLNGTVLVATGSYYSNRIANLITVEYGDDGNIASFIFQSLDISEYNGSFHLNSVTRSFNSDGSITHLPGGNFLLT